MDNRRIRAVGTKLVLVLWCIGLQACATAQPPTASAPPVSGVAATVSNGTNWVRGSAEYVALTRQVYRQAQAFLETTAPARRPGPWAVILDADETVLNNVQYQVEREGSGQTYSTESWNAWVKRREAIPVPGSAAFLARVKALGGVVAIVTNRLESECDDTRAVFRAHQLPFDVMLCRPNGTPSDKNPRFAMVAAGQFTGAPGPVDVVAVVGDNILDFPSLSQSVRDQSDAAFAAFGTKYFVLPNPMYGSWQR